MFLLILEVITVREALKILGYWVVNPMYFISAFDSFHIKKQNDLRLTNSRSYMK